MEKKIYGKWQRKFTGRALALFLAGAVCFSDGSLLMSYASSVTVSGNTVTVQMDQTQEAEMVDVTFVQNSISDNSPEESTDQAETESAAEIIEESEFESASETTEETESETETETESIEETETYGETEEETEAVLWGLTNEQQLSAAAELEALLDDQPVTALIYLCDSYNLSRQPEDTQAVQAVLKSGHQVQVTGYALTEDTFFYQVRTWVYDTEISGYVDRENLAYADERLLAWEEKWFQDMWLEGAGAETDYADVMQFPESYREKLYALKSEHPNWVFVRMDTDAGWDDAVKYELNAHEDRSRSLVPASYPDHWKYGKYNSSWYYASESALKYCMDPRNFLEETYIFQFEQLTYNASYHSAAGVQSFLDSTFMKGEIPGEGMTYAQAFWEIGNAQNVSPYHLASRVYQEQGKGTSPLISGTYAGYEGLYNYFNVGASGKTDAEVISTGLTYAREKGWNTRYKALSGGANVIAQNYILKGQDTLYLQKFDVDNSYKGMYWHQYMQNILAPSSEAQSILKLYKNAESLENTFVFRIPVYPGMPGQACQVLEKPLEKITFSDGQTESITFLEMNRDEMRELTLNYYPEDTTDDKKITWSCLNPEILDINTEENRVTVTAKKAGTAVVTARVGAREAKCEIKVSVPMTGIVFETLFSEIYTGQEKAVKAVLLPEDTTETAEILLESSNPEILLIDGGKAYGKKEGNVQITASAGEYSVSMPVVVKNCEVVFYDGDQALETRKLSYGEQLGELPANHKDEGYWFGGWFTRQEGMGILLTSSYKVKESVAVYGYWKELSSEMFAEPVSDQYYTGTAIRPEPSVYDSYGKRLTRNVDYTLSWKNNTKVHDLGTTVKQPTVTITGKGNYSGTKTISFRILPAELGDENITADEMVVSYNAKMQKPVPVIKYGTKTLKVKTDFVVSYPDTQQGAYREPGNWTIELAGIGNFTGKKTFTFTIVSTTPVSALKVSKIPVQDYVSTPDGVCPELIVTDPATGMTLIQGEDYRVQYFDNKLPGTAYVLISGGNNGRYAGSKKVSFTIRGISIAKASVSGIQTNVVWSGEAVEQPEAELTVDINGQPVLLTADDYDVTYQKNDKVGTAAVIFTGKGGYTGRIKKTYKILAANLENQITEVVFTQGTDQFLYEKGGVKPEVSVTADGIKLVENKDYTLAYSNNKSVNDRSSNKTLPTVKVSGKGNYKGKLTLTFEIIPQSLEKMTVTASDLAASKSKGKWKAVPNVTDLNGKKLTAGTDYTVIYTYAEDTQVQNGKKWLTRTAGEEVQTVDIVPPQTRIKVRICENPKAKKINYIGENLSCSYQITEFSLQAASVKVLGKWQYTGEEICLSGEDVLVTYQGEVLQEDVDYIFLKESYANNKNKGKATVMMQGIGRFGGTKKITFTITAKPFWF